MAADSRDVNLEMTEEQQAAGDSRGEVPPTPIAVPTVSEKVPAESVDGKKARVPRRILHFSDGTMEEYSTDEDEPDQPAQDALTHLRTENPKSMGWLPWAWWWFRYAGYRTLGGVDNMGEKLAYMLGITSPKYQYELDEYYEMKKKEEEEKAQRDLEEAGWSPGTALTSEQPAGPGPTAYLVGGDGAEPVTTPPTAGRLPDQTAAGVSGQPVAATTTP
ncbi:protein FAM177A1-like [Amphibalanus amphitrite]|uniref:protein FAM177A1-like n=1 Tax=Amphibalanus amphitrite TaxID=1232801 RepID=UPI001C90D8C5|nr:protein FAM177A1-like [Amphibalanus amphitrite]